VKLYDRAAPILAEQHGYDLDRQDHRGVIHYHFTKRDQGRLGEPDAQAAREDSYSWLAPSGKFYPIPAGKTHQEAATVAHKSAMPLLKASGWHRVFHIGRELWTDNEMVPPNSRQRQALKDHAIEHGFTHVLHDYGDGERTLWSSGDQV
jgi:hypothetical protein